MDNICTADGALHIARHVLRINGHGARCRRESREDVQGVEGEGR